MDNNTPPAMTTIESRYPKRSFTDFDELNPPSQPPRTTKRLQVEALEAEQAAKTIQQQQPEPPPLKCAHPLRLRDIINQLPSSSAAEKNGFISQWLESVSRSELVSESYRESHRWSRDADGFAISSKPSSGSPSRQEDTASDTLSVSPSAISYASTGSTRESVKDPNYRDNNLAENNIYMQDFYREFPEDIARLVNHIRKDRDSPGPSLDQLRQDTDLEELEMGTAKPAVENYFKANIFPSPGKSDSLGRIDKDPMAKHGVPDVGSKLKVSTPCPDMLYGYNHLGAFPQQQAQLRSIGNEIIANTQGLLYPFLVIEFKADGPRGCGSMWVAMNQCLGASASCVNIVERLNCQLRQCKSDKIQPINSAAFSIAMNGTVARLFISWKQNDLDYYMQGIKSFLLQEPEEYVEFRKHVRNIIDWGKDKRLEEIRKSLDSLLEEGRRETSGTPLDISATSSSRKCKASLRKGKPPTNSRRGKVKESSSRADNRNS